jgi:hypothetical protein
MLQTDSCTMDLMLYETFQRILDARDRLEVFDLNAPEKRKFFMTLIKLRKANETGEEEGTLFLNADQIVAVTAGMSTTEVQMADGRTRWVKETPEEVATLAKT